MPTLQDIWFTGIFYSCVYSSLPMIILLRHSHFQLRRETSMCRNCINSPAHTCRAKEDKMAGIFRAGRSILRSVTGHFHGLKSSPRVLVLSPVQAGRCISTIGPRFSANRDILKCIDEEIRMETVPALPHIGDFEVGCSCTEI